MMKKIISMFLALMLFCSMTVTAMAESFQVTPDKTSMAPGEQVTVTIKVKEKLTGTFRSVQGQLIYNPDVMTYVSHTMGKDYADYASKNILAKKYVTFSKTDLTEAGFTVIPQGTIATVTFQANSKLTQVQVKTAFSLKMSVQDTAGKTDKTVVDTTITISRPADPTPSPESKPTQCSHDWKKATCTAPKTCKLCKKTQGSALGHSITTIKGKAATCTKTGLTNGKKCSVCGTITVKQKTIAKLAHSYKTTITKATTSKDGKIVKKCSCGYTGSTTVIRKASKISLSKSAYTYTGKKISPKLIIKDSKGKTISSKYYTVTKPKKMPKEIGTYTYTVKFKGDKYTGSKKLKLTIKPAKTTIKVPKAEKKAITVNWTKGKKAQITGYQILLATNSKFTAGKKTINVKGYKNVSKKVTKLKAKKTYYMKVRTYKTVKGVKVYSDWSKVKKIKTK